MAVNQVMAAGDDAARQIVTSTFTPSTDGQASITPQPNVLDQYPSYNYSVSLYLVSPEAFQQMVNSGDKSLKGAQLLMQSAGAPLQGRNPYFSLDYYIEKLTLESTMAGKGSGQAHNVNKLHMTVVEPNGITLLANLERAVLSYLGSGDGKPMTVSAQVYLVVIRFYGYQEDGTPVECGQNGAVVEKYYPVAITNITFKVASRAVEYEIEMTPSQYQTTLGQNRGSLPTNIELGGLTVKEVLLGNTQNNATAGGSGDGRASDATANQSKAAPEKASASTGPKTSIRQGLVQMLNSFQQDLVRQGKYKYADTYAIEFKSDSISNAKVLVTGGDQKGTGMPTNATAADQTVPDKQSVDPQTRLTGFTAGMPIVKIIEQVIRNSTYVTEQSNTAISEKTGEQIPNKASGKNVQWFKINLQATPSKYDPNRNDYAYDMKFVVTPYKITSLISPYFDMPKYSGAHKSYNYWFTGLNTSVLSYEQDINCLYSVILSGSGGATGGTFVNDLVQQCYYPRSGQSSQGAVGLANDIGASAADYLYNPSDYAKVTLQIVGDPAWLQQGEVFSVAAVDDTPFMADGTINVDAGQVNFEVLFNRPVDYDLATGLMDPNTNGSQFQNGSQMPGASRQSTVYLANKVTSEFTKGKFTQTLQGTYVQFYPDQSFKEAQNFARVAPTQSGAASRDTSNDLSAGNTNPDTTGTQNANPPGRSTGVSGSTTNTPNPSLAFAPTPKPVSSNGGLNPAPAAATTLNNALGGVTSGAVTSPASAAAQTALAGALFSTPAVKSQLINRET